MAAKDNDNVRVVFCLYIGCPQQENPCHQVRQPCSRSLNDIERLLPIERKRKKSLKDLSTRDQDEVWRHVGGTITRKSSFIVIRMQATSVVEEQSAAKAT